MISIRLATASEFEWLREMQRRTLAEPAPDLLETAVTGYPPVYVAVDGQPLGYAIVVPGPETVAYLAELAVTPERQREGHGSAIVEHVCTKLHQKGYEQLRLSVLATDEGARTFYRDCGFEPVERLPDEFDLGDGMLLERGLGAE